MLVFFTHISFMEFHVRCLALFLFFLVIDDLKWFWMGSLHKNIQLLLEFLKFLVLYFFLLYINDLPDDVVSTVSVIRHLICGTNWNWLLNLNLIYKTLTLLISTLEKLNWFHLTVLITMVLLMWKWMGLFWRKNRLLRCWAVPYPELFWSWYTGLGSQIQTPKFLKMLA